jgi:16S rRNA (uracil1498-N3)-methyltransferase
MPRFYCPVPLHPGETVDLPEGVAHHLHVVRMAVGEELVLFNGDGGEVVALLEAVEKRRARARVLVHVAREAELPFAVTLAQALPEGSKMDWIVEKAVEMGVAAIQPLSAQRCVVRLSGEREDKKRGHWQGIIEAASEQCGRNRLLRLHELNDVRSWSSQQDLHKRILLTPRGTDTLAGWARHQPPQALALMVGPEGGFSREEEDHALAHGALALTMGSRVLRTETAAIAAMGMLQSCWT